MSRAAGRTPVKLHKNVTLIRTSDPVSTEEILARKGLARYILGRLTDNVLLVRPDDLEPAIEELRRSGQTPRVVR